MLKSQSKIQVGHQTILTVTQQPIAGKTNNRAVQSEAQGLFLLLRQFEKIPEP